MVARANILWLGMCIVKLIGKHKYHNWQVSIDQHNYNNLGDAFTIKRKPQLCAFTILQCIVKHVMLQFEIIWQHVGLLCCTELQCKTFRKWRTDILFCIEQYIELYCIVLYCIVLYCIVLYCIVLYCKTLYNTTLYIMMCRHVFL